MISQREELAWAAGFFDGEGHVSASRYSGHREMTIAIPQIDRRVLDRFASAVGVGRVYGPFDTATPTRPNCRPQWRYRVTGHERIQAVCAMLWMWLDRVKREQFTKTLTAWPIKPHRKYSGPCVHGVRRTKDCRACQRQYQRTYLSTPEHRILHRDRTRRFRAAHKLVAVA